MENATEPIAENTTEPIAEPIAESIAESTTETFNMAPIPEKSTINKNNQNLLSFD